MSNESKFSAIMEGFKTNSAEFNKFISDPTSTLQKAGIPLIKEWFGGGEFPKNISMLPELIAAVSRSSEIKSRVSITETEQIQANMNWWGIDIIMNETLTQDIIAGIEVVGALGEAIALVLVAAGIVTEGVSTVIGAGLAIAILLKLAEISLADAGDGVHWPITWLQWPPVLASVLGGPAGVALSCAIWIHPVRN